MKKELENTADQVYDLISNGRTAEAMDIAQKLVDLNMSDATAWYTYGYAKKSWGDKELAEKGFKQAAAINPSYSEAYVALADLYADEENYAAVIENLDKALSVNSQNIMAMSLKVHAVNSMLGTDEAIQYCENYIQTADEKTELENLLGSLYLEKAEEYLADIPDDPGNPQGETTLSFISLKDIETARGLCTKAMSLLTSDDDGGNYKSDCKLILKRCNDDCQINRWSKISSIIFNMVITFIFYSVIMAIAQFNLAPIAAIAGIAALIVPWLNIPAARFPQYQINYAIYTGSYPWKFQNKTISNSIGKATDVTTSQSWVGLIAKGIADSLMMRFFLYKRWIKSLKNKISKKK